jgi:hypothetical protein
MQDGHISSLNRAEPSLEDPHKPREYGRMDVCMCRDWYQGTQPGRMRAHVYCNRDLPQTPTAGPLVVRRDLRPGGIRLVLVRHATGSPLIHGFLRRIVLLLALRRRRGGRMGRLSFRCKGADM